MGDDKGRNAVQTHPEENIICKMSQDETQIPSTQVETATCYHRINAIKES